MNNRDFLYPHEKCLCVHTTNPPLSLNFTKTLRSRLYSVRTSRETLTGERAKYKLYRNRITNLTRLSKKLYFHSFCNDNINNIKKTWQGINCLISNDRKAKKPITALKDPNTNTIIRDKSKLPGVINKHFASVGQKLASRVPNSNTHFADYLKHIKQKKSFYFSSISEKEVEREIMTIPNNKSHGLYSYPVKIIKLAKCLLSKPLTQIFNASIQKGKYLSKLKVSKATPVFKDDDDTDPNNYRLISLLSIFNRIFEKLIYKRLVNFIEIHNLIDNAQYGFRTGFSTNHAILDIISSIKSNMDKKCFSCAVFIDLKKAFDTVDHSILLKMLYIYGVRGIVNDWFKSYLLNRTQITEIDGFLSEKEIQSLWCHSRLFSGTPTFPFIHQ